jgi:hypothetical protein
MSTSELRHGRFAPIGDCITLGSEPSTRGSRRIACPAKDAL